MGEIPDNVVTYLSVSLTVPYKMRWLAKIHDKKGELLPISFFGSTEDEACERALAWWETEKAAADKLQKARISNLQKAHEARHKADPTLA